MEFYILVLITALTNNIKTEVMSIDPTMAECFEERDKLIEIYGRPIIDYQAVCIRKTGYLIKK